VRLLIQGCAVLPMTGKEEFIPEGYIAVEDGIILGVGPVEDLKKGQTLPANWEPERLLNGSGMVAMPGLINAHTHAAMTLFRGYADDMELMPWLQEKIWPAEGRLQAEDVYWGTLLAVIEMLKSGTTCFADMYFFMEEAAKAVEISGIRASLSRGLIGVSGEGDRVLDEASEFFCAWNGKARGRISVWLGPHAPYTCPPAFLERVIKRADDLKTGIHIHLAETKTEVEDIYLNYGETPVKLMDKMGLFERPVLAAHCVHLSEEEIEILARRQTGIAHNPESNMKLASGVAPVPSLLARGAIVGLGTDGAASNNNLDLWGEMRAAALLHKVISGNPTVLPAYQVLEMATCGGARALGLEGEVGRLLPGRRADLILVDMEHPHLCPLHDITAHLVYSAHATDVHTVIVDGRIVVEGGRILTVDEDEVMHQVTRRARRLVEGL